MYQTPQIQPQFYPPHQHPHQQHSQFFPNYPNYPPVHYNRFQAPFPNSNPYPLQPNSYQ